mgnify:CR=1 FL=1
MVSTMHAVDRDELTLTTFNVWFDTYCGIACIRAIARAVGPRYAGRHGVSRNHRRSTDHLSVPTVDQRALPERGGRRRQDRQLRHADVARLPTARVTYTRLPTRLSRGFLKAEFTVNGKPLVVCSVHLESGKRNVRLRGRPVAQVVPRVEIRRRRGVLGDFKHGTRERARSLPPDRIVWLALRPDDDGFTEDTAINHMRYDSKPSTGRSASTRVLLKGHHRAAAHINLLGPTRFRVRTPSVSIRPLRRDLRCWSSQPSSRG